METIVIKIGGVASDNLTPEFFQVVHEWQAAGKKVVIVHGGGHYISEMMEKMALPVTIKDGLRVTDPQTLEVTRMVLLGQVQPMITTRFQKAGLQAVGLNAGCDQLITGAVIDEDQLGFVGQVAHINTVFLQLLTQKQHIPIIAPLGITEAGQWLNINADEVACQVAASLQAEKLFLLTDVPGIKKDNEWLGKVAFSEMAALIEDRVVTGGMLPKVLSAQKALLAGVSTVCITDQISHDGTEIFGVDQLAVMA
ncbi:acetylglutamate kinase [Enterococcus sp. 8G7_MSG3316]|uniref:Acetylglutamate kinase n=1 Tax=Candidatus Enterococcus testudinis TaxID=1834191 RepID=A0A242A362_9ENTE|nr:acetylglutamate kinase [Enterococcus sp. 8G7_MSG3316]OTN75359.1 acetylglutamate kinase [Enterococcus sp. 8G7_MSG3316]